MSREIKAISSDSNPILKFRLLRFRSGVVKAWKRVELPLCISSVLGLIVNLSADSATSLPFFLQSFVIALLSSGHKRSLQNWALEMAVTK